MVLGQHMIDEGHVPVPVARPVHTIDNQHRVRTGIDPGAAKDLGHRVSASARRQLAASGRRLLQPPGCRHGGDNAAQLVSQRRHDACVSPIIL
jgi:hypothetical protein